MKSSLHDILEEELINIPIPDGEELWDKIYGAISSTPKTKRTLIVMFPMKWRIAAASAAVMVVAVMWLSFYLSRSPETATITDPPIPFDPPVVDAPDFERSEIYFSAEDFVTLEDIIEKAELSVDADCTIVCDNLDQIIQGKAGAYSIEVYALNSESKISQNVSITVILE